MSYCSCLFLSVMISPLPAGRSFSEYKEWIRDLVLEGGLKVRVPTSTRHSLLPIDPETETQVTPVVGKHGFVHYAEMSSSTFKFSVRSPKRRFLRIQDSPYSGVANLEVGAVCLWCIDIFACMCMHVYSMYVCIHPSIHLSIYLSIHPSIHPLIR